MNNVGVIDQFLNTFTTYIDSGFGLIKGEVTYLSSTLIVIDITLAGLFWAWGADEDVLQRLIKKTLYIGFFAFLIGNFNTLAAAVFNSFAGLGLKAGGSTLSTANFLQPGRLAQVGLDAGQPMLDSASQMMGFTSFFANFVQIAVLMVSLHNERLRSFQSAQPPVMTTISIVPPLRAVTRSVRDADVVTKLISGNRCLKSVMVARRLPPERQV